MSVQGQVPPTQGRRSLGPRSGTRPGRPPVLVVATGPRARLGRRGGTRREDPGVVGGGDLGGSRDAPKGRAGRDSGSDRARPREALQSYADRSAAEGRQKRPGVGEEHSLQRRSLGPPARPFDVPGARQTRLSARAHRAGDVRADGGGATRGEGACGPCADLLTPARPRPCRGVSAFSRVGGGRGPWVPGKFSAAASSRHCSIFTLPASDTRRRRAPRPAPAPQERPD